MATAVVVPWRPSDPHRKAAWSWVRHQYALHHPDWEIVTGSCGDGPWIKADAITDALTRTDADTLLIADADVWCDGLGRAVDALDQFPWAIPHHTVQRLTEQATAEVLAGGDLAGPFTQQPYKGWAGGGYMALRRETYERIPLDPRFQGWGGEDAAWHLALVRLTGRGWRGRALLWHLWHPPQPRMSRVIGSEASGELLNRYRKARNTKSMSELIAEVSEWRTSASSSTARASATSSAPGR